MVTSTRVHFKINKINIITVMATGRMGHLVDDNNQTNQK